MNKRQKGYQAESLVASYLIALGYTILHQNYTIRGGELDIVAEKDNDRVFVEVKEVSNTTDLSDYISARKLRTLYKTITFFNYEYVTNKQIRVDIAFVKENHIIYYSKNISNT